MAEESNSIQKAWGTILKGGGNLLAAITDPLENLSLTGEKLTGLVNKYFGSEAETLTAYRDANPASEAHTPIMPVAVSAPSKEAAAEQVSTAMPQGVEDAVKLAMRVTSTSVSTMVSSMQSMSESALSTLAAAQGGAPAMTQAKTTNQSAGNAPSLV